MKKLFTAAISCCICLFWFGCSTDNSDNDLNTFVSASVVSFGQSAQRTETAHFDFVQPMAAWKIVFKIGAIYDRKGWRLASKDENLCVAVQDPAGQFQLYTGIKPRTKMHLIIERDVRSKLITGVYLAPPDMIPAGEPEWSEPTGQP